VAKAGPDQTVTADTSVKLDGNSSTDDGLAQPLTFTWKEGVVVLGTGNTLVLPFSEGVHTVTLEVFDGEFITTDEMVITVNPVAVPKVAITAPANGTTLNIRNVEVSFSVENWTVGGKGGTHIHFHLDGSADHLMFYYSTDQMVEFNEAPGPTPIATWVNANTIRFNGLTPGMHSVRAHLATVDHKTLGNPEADVTIFFVVNGPPVITTDAEHFVMEGELHTHMVNFTDPNTGDVHTGDINWGVGELNEALVIAEADGSGSAGPSHTFPDDGDFTATITICDNLQACSTVQSTMHVENVPVEIVAMSLSSGVIKENGTVKLTGDFTDPGSKDTHKVKIEWGDGSRDTLDLALGDRAFAASHQYVDDDPTGTASDVYTIQVTASDDDLGSDVDTTSVTVENVAPAAIATGDSIDEGGNATVTAIYGDVGTKDTHTANIDWGDGVTSGPFQVTGGSLDRSHVYGDNGTYIVTLRVVDDDTGVGVTTATVSVRNLAPRVTLNTTAAIVFTGGKAFLGRSGDAQSHSAFATDPGSDDLSFTWSFGQSTTYFNNSVSPDALPSSDGTFPFSTSDTGIVTFTKPGVQNIGVVVRDDDGGTGDGSLTKIVVDDCDCTKSQGFWKQQFKTGDKGRDDDEDDGGGNRIEESALKAYLDIVNFVSSVFSETVPVNNIGDANLVFNPEKNRDSGGGGKPTGEGSGNALTESGNKKKKKPGGKGDEDNDDTGTDNVDKMRSNALAQTLAAWLNFAKGGIGLDEMVDTDGDGKADTAFSKIMAEVESILNNPNATKADLERGKDLAEAVNLHDEDNPACDTDTGNGSETGSN